jgi:hypothetical protein
MTLNCIPNSTTALAVFVIADEDHQNQRLPNKVGNCEDKRSSAQYGKHKISQDTAMMLERQQLRQRIFFSA